MKIFLDDYRDPIDCIGYMQARIGALNPIYLENWIIVRNYNQFKMTIMDNIDKITHISFDHDLAEEHYAPEEYWDDKYNEWETSKGFKEKTGFDCAKWMKEFYDNMGKDYPAMFVHSMNPVGTKRIIDLFNN